MGLRMKHYLDMTMSELEQERQAIVKEVERRLALAKRAQELGFDIDAAYEPYRDGDSRDG